MSELGVGFAPEPKDNYIISLRVSRAEWDALSVRLAGRAALGKGGGHWSDCAVYNAPALIPGSCDCGGLELAVDPVHGTIVPLVANARCAGILVEDVEEGGFVEVQKPSQPP